MYRKREKSYALIDWKIVLFYPCYVKDTYFIFDHFYSSSARSIIVDEAVDLQFSKQFL